MAQTEYRDVLSVAKDKLLATITEYKDYPKFIEGCTAAKVESLSDGQVRVHYEVNIMSQDVKYTLDHRVLPESTDGSSRVEWTLVDSNFFKKNIGHWVVKPAGAGKTDVTYALDVEFKIPVPGFILNRLVKGSLPGMVKGFEKQALKK